jgi:4-diphosphocytidyl-2-C-methyl-D-erythritol kinase
MIPLRETGWAKLNLTLEVLGRRPDGFHEIRSLVAFAGLGDRVELEPGAALDPVVEGPFARALGGDNLIVKAANAAMTRAPDLRLGRFRLVKNLPVAAGLGGGSADAGAALRLILSAGGGAVSEAEIAAFAPMLGSDVSVCFTSRPSLIMGRGEMVEPVRGFPSCGVLLANPGVPLATEAVYAALRAQPLGLEPGQQAESLAFENDFARLLAYALPSGNDLEAPAARLVPEIREVLAALLALDGARLVRLSGSGPTCFALFASEEEAQRAAPGLAAAHPRWWVAASSLGS